MSIASEITRLQTAKADIKTSIEAKGVTVPSTAKLDDYSDYVDQIQTGGSTSEYVSYDISGTTIDSDKYITSFNWSYLSQVVYGDYIYGFGYYDASHPSAIVKYNYKTNIETLLSATLPDTYTTTGYLNPTVVGDYIYLFGGLMSTSSAANNRVLKFNPANDTIEQTALLNFTISRTINVVVGNYVYLINGYAPGTSPTSKKVIWKYDLTNNTATEVGNRTGDYFYPAHCVVGTDIYCFGGWNGGTTATSCTDGAFKIDTTTDTITALASMPYLNDYTASTFNNGNYIYIFGGRTRGSSSYAINTILKYDITNNSYTTLTDTFDTNIIFIIPYQKDNLLYLIGGNSGNSTTAEGWNDSLVILNLNTDTLTKINSAYIGFYQAERELRLHVVDNDGIIIVDTHNKKGNVVQKFNI